MMDKRERVASQGAGARKCWQLFVRN